MRNLEKTAKQRNFREYAQSTDTIRTPFIQQCLAAIIILMIFTGLRTIPIPAVEKALATVDGYLGYQMSLKRVYCEMDQVVMKSKNLAASLAERFGWEVPWHVDTPSGDIGAMDAVPVFAVSEGLAGFSEEPEVLKEEPIAFLIPVSGPVTSGYGERVHPATGKDSFHSGVDIGGALDSPICVAEKGTVTKVGYDDINGNYVQVAHREGYETHYAHLASVSVTQGQELQKGAELGIMGNTGLTVGTGHLHFEVYQNGQSLDPAQFFSFSQI